MYDRSTSGRDGLREGRVGASHAPLPRGRPAFFEAIRAYHRARVLQRDHGGFQDRVRVGIGIDLDSFFGEWVYQAGYPSTNTRGRRTATARGITSIFSWTSSRPTLPFLRYRRDPRDDDAARSCRDSRSRQRTNHELVFDDEPSVSIRSLQPDPQTAAAGAYGESPPTARSAAEFPRSRSACRRTRRAARPRIDFLLGEKSDVALDVYDAAGRRVASSRREALAPGGTHCRRRRGDARIDRAVCISTASARARARRRASSRSSGDLLAQIARQNGGGSRSRAHEGRHAVRVIVDPVEVEPREHPATSARRTRPPPLPCPRSESGIPGGPTALRAQRTLPFSPRVRATRSRSKASASRRARSLRHPRSRTCPRRWRARRR